MFVPVLYSHTCNNKQTRNEFIMENKYEVLGLKAKLWGLEAKPPADGGNRGPGGGAPSFWRFL